MKKAPRAPAWPDPAGLSDADLASGISLEVPSERDWGSMQRMLGLLSELWQRTPLTERETKDLKQAVTEMAGNAMEWGHGFDPSRNILVSYRVEPDAVVVSVEDGGPGFHDGPGPHPEAALEESMGRRGGFGIMLARGLVDEFFYNDRGNHVTLIKRFGAGR